MSSVFKCLRPRIIINASGQRVNVSCGKCEACLSKKSSIRAKMCVLESREHDYTEFITLTYSQENLPFCRVVTYGDNRFIVNVTPRLNVRSSSFIASLSSSVVGSLPSNVSDDCITDVLYKTYSSDAKTQSEYGEGYIPYVSRVDAQRFLKRLRYYFYELCNKNGEQYVPIRYYLASEYGPKHFRPHFHLLLFHSSSFLRENLSRLLRQAWTFGNIDYSKAQNNGRCSSYVASYCNQFAFLPKLYDCKGLRPFSLHSIRFGCKSFSDEFEAIISGKNRDIAPAIIPFGDRLREVYAPLSLSTTLLPRCFRYVLSNSYVRYKLYTLFGRTVTRYGIENPTEFVVSNIIKYVEPAIWSGLSNLFGETLTGENIDSIVSSSYRYYRLCQQYPCVDVRKRIDDYYSDYELRRLGDFYRSQVEFISRYGVGCRQFLVHYYDNVYLPDAPASYNRQLSHVDKLLSYNFFLSINIEPEFMDHEQLGYTYNPAYNEACLLSKFIFNQKTKTKKYNDSYHSTVFNY